MRRALTTLFILAASGCASTLSTMDTARPTPVGHVHANLAAGAFIPAGSILRALEAGDDAAKLLNGEGSRISPAQADALYEAAMSVALMPPALQQELMLRTGVMENLDVGLRLATTSTRLDAKYRFFQRGNDAEWSHHASVGLGVSKYSFKGLVFDVLEKVKLDDFSRWDFEIPVLYSAEYGDYFRFYGGAKYILTAFEMDGNLFELQSRVADALETPPATDQVKSKAHFLGGVLGVGAGYKYAFLFLELNAGYMSSKPRLYSFVDGEVRQRSLGGATLYPAVGLVLKI